MIELLLVISTNRQELFATGLTTVLSLVNIREVVDNPGNLVDIIKRYLSISVHFMERQTNDC